jgi:hypothetical protein
MKWLRDPERRDIVEREVWLPQRRSFLRSRAPTNNEGKIAELEPSLKLLLQPRIVGGEKQGISSRNNRVTAGYVPVLMRLDASPFIVDDAIVGLAQPLTKSLNQVASGPRRVGNLFEELGRGKEFHLNLAGGSGGRTARAVFQDAHFPDKLHRAD